MSRPIVCFADAANLVEHVSSRRSHHRYIHRPMVLDHASVEDSVPLSKAFGQGECKHLLSGEYQARPSESACYCHYFCSFK